MLTTTLALSMLLMGPDVKIEDLKDGFNRVTTKKYVVEVLKGWEVGEETSFGQREFHSNKGEFGTMTGSAGNRGWEPLYQTSLYFIRRSVAGEPTPYKIIKTKQGYEAMSFGMMKDGKPMARYVILKNTKNEILALSVRITDRKSEKDLEAAFDRMVSTAKML